MRDGVYIPEFYGSVGKKSWRPFSLSACLHKTSEICSFVKSISLCFLDVVVDFSNLKKSVDFLLYLTSDTFFKTVSF